MLWHYGTILDHYVVIYSATPVFWYGCFLPMCRRIYDSVEKLKKAMAIWIQVSKRD